MMRKPGNTVQTAAPRRSNRNEFLFFDLNTLKKEFTSAKLTFQWFGTDSKKNRKK